jgi:protein O-mannosyl-transferase
MKWLIIAVAAVVAALTAYWPALGGEAIWDDRFLVGENPFFRTPSLAAESFAHPLYPFSAAAYYRPLNVSYAFDYAVWGGSHRGYHVTNVLLHGIAAVLLWGLLRRLTGIFAPSLGARARAFIPAAAAGCWLLHPIHHAAVGYVSGRADSIAAVLALGAWLLFEKSREVGGAMRLVASVGAVSLALAAPFAKEIALVWFALFAVRVIADRGIRRCGGVAVCVLGAVVIAYAIVRGAALHGVAGSGAEARPWSDRLVLFAQAIGDYARIIVWPFDLHMERRLTPWSPPAPPAFLHPLTATGAAVLIAAGWLAIRPGGCRNLRRLGIGWFFIGFAPVSNLVPLNAEVAEHWIYMPSAGALMVIASLVPRPGSRIAHFATAVVCLALAARTFDQCSLWISEEQFFRRTISAGGDSARLSSNLASLLGRRGEIAAAEAELRRGIARFPNTGMLRVDLAENLIRQQRITEAVAELDLAPAVPQAPWSVALTRAKAHVAEERAEQALRVLDEADATWPGRWDITRLRAVILERTGRGVEAVAALRGYTAGRWWHRAAVTEFARALAASGEHEEAAANYLQASRLDPRDHRPWSAIADIRLAQGRIFDAVAAQQVAVRRVPGDAAERARLDRLLQLQRRPPAG